MKKTSPESARPLGTLNKRLDQYAGKVLFPEKLKQAQETLARVGLPAVWMEEAAATAKTDASAASQAKPTDARPKRAA